MTNVLGSKPHELTKLRDDGIEEYKGLRSREKGLPDLEDPKTSTSQDSNTTKTMNLSWMSEEEGSDAYEFGDVSDFDAFSNAISTRPSNLQIGYYDDIVWKGGKGESDYLPRGLEDRTSSVPMPPGPGYEEINYTFICSDANTAAIFVPTRQKTRLKAMKNEMSTKDLIYCIENGGISQSQLVAVLLDHKHQSKFDIFFQSLLAINETTKIYSQL